MLVDQLDDVVGVDPHRDRHALAVVELPEVAATSAYDGCCRSHASCAMVRKRVQPGGGLLCHKASRALPIASSESSKRSAPTGAHGRQLTRAKTAEHGDPHVASPASRADDDALAGTAGSG